MWPRPLAGSRGRTVPAGDPRAAKLFDRVRGRGGRQTPPHHLVDAFCGLLPPETKKGPICGGFSCRSGGILLV